MFDKQKIMNYNNTAAALRKQAFGAKVFILKKICVITVSCYFTSRSFICL